MFQDQIDNNMLEALRHLLKILGKTRCSEIEVVCPRVFRHISQRGIVTIARGYLSYREYDASGDDGSLQRCNGFYFTLTKGSVRGLLEEKQMAGSGTSGRCSASAGWPPSTTK